MTNIIKQLIPAKNLEWKETDEMCTYTWHDAMELGKDGWRLPTKEELLALYQSGLMPSNRAYWSSSPIAGYNNGAWIVYFDYGNEGSSDKYNNFYVRLVRGGQN